MGFSLELVKAKRRIVELETKVAELEKQFVPPPPPQSLGRIESNELRTILQGAFVIPPNLGSYDWELTSVSEYKRFLDWYRDTHPYTPDERDCNVFAWEMTARALKWMNSKFPWGYIWASSADLEYPFPNHGFCFIIDNEKKLYFCDELEVAAARDDFEPFYPVIANLVIIN